MAELTTPKNMRDDTPVKLTPDQREVTLKMTREIAGVASWIADLIKREQFTVSNRSTSVGLLVHYVRDIGKAVGHDADIAVEREHDLATIRALHGEIADLRHQIGESAPVEGMSERLSLIGRDIDEWWRGLGFCLHEINIRPSSHRTWVNAEFSTMLDDGVTTFSETPVSDREHARTRLDELRSSGLDVHVGEDREYPKVVDTPASREWIMTRLRERFPSVRLWKWKALTLGERSRPDASQIRAACVNFDFADLIRFDSEATEDSDRDHG